MSLIYVQMPSVKNDFAELPFEGICGKCANYKPKLDKDYLCEFCLLAGVKVKGTLSRDVDSELRRFVKLRVK